MRNVKKERLRLPVLYLMLAAVFFLTGYSLHGAMKKSREKVVERTSCSGCVACRGLAVIVRQVESIFSITQKEKSLDSLKKIINQKKRKLNTVILNFCALLGDRVQYREAGDDYIVDDEYNRYLDKNERKKRSKEKAEEKEFAKLFDHILLLNNQPFQHEKEMLTKALATMTGCDRAATMLFEQLEDLLRFEKPFVNKKNLHTPHKRIY